MSTVPEAERVPPATRVAYGSSAFAENLAINSVNQLANPVFNLTLGVSPTLVGTAIALPRLWDAVMDPWIGNLSDNARTRWGRRRPFILIGAFLTALCTAGIWFFPEGRSPTFYFGWLAIGCFLLSTAYSIFVVPYGALGLELTRDYHERTRLMGSKSMLHKLSGVLNQWLLKIVQIVGQNNLVAGSRFCGVIIGCLVAVLGAITVWRVPERARPAVATGPKLSLWQGWRETMKRGDFVRLGSAQMLIYASFLIVDNTGFYLNVFYVNGGDMAKGALLKGFAGMAFQLGGLAAIPGIVWLSQRIGKKNTFLLCTASLVVAGVSKWFCYVPDAGWLLVIPSLLLAPGLVAVMVLVPSMTADICDLDEVKTGARREGMFNAVLGWKLKVALSGSIFLAGVALELTGWQTNLKAAQSEETFFAMRVAFSVGTIVFALIAAAIIAGYRVTEETVAESRRAMQARSNAAG
ncbi:MAG: MFS transporter [Opitutaceae bacterium]|nr:MFS transporter [Opitutaceae bacterium]